MYTHSTLNSSQKMSNCQAMLKERTVINTLMVNSMYNTG